MNLADVQLIVCSHTGSLCCFTLSQPQSRNFIVVDFLAKSNTQNILDNFEYEVNLYNVSVTFFTFFLSNRTWNFRASSYFRTGVGKKGSQSINLSVNYYKWASPDSLILQETISHPQKATYIYARGKKVRPRFRHAPRSCSGSDPNCPHFPSTPLLWFCLNYVVVGYRSDKLCPSHVSMSISFLSMAEMQKTGQ